ncbi:MAG: 2-hydroxy-3-oxopropionate reductase [Chloroflexi bacterium]|nr:2-hydroxy-3-oxopropionate reductase [Chloroflexota bacterium]
MTHLQLPNHNGSAQTGPTGTRPELLSDHKQAPLVKKTGYVGIGLIGSAIAANVIKGGFDLMVYDLDQARLREFAALGAKVAASLAEIAGHSEVVEISVPEDAGVEAVTLGEDGLVANSAPGTVIVIHSTIHPSTVRRIASAAKERGVDVLDAGVGGGAPGAKAQTLCYMVGGDAAALERCRPVFDTSAKYIYHMGEAGMGVAAKLAEQIMTVLTIEAAAEGFRLAEAAGLPLDLFDQAIAVGGPQSRIASNWLRQWSKGVGPQALHGFYVGLNPALQLAHEVGAALPATALAQQLLPQFLGKPDSPS